MKIKFYELKTSKIEKIMNFNNGYDLFKIKFVVIYHGIINSQNQSKNVCDRS